jgi:hypothetical protein
MKTIAIPAIVLSFSLSACVAPTQYASTPAYNKYTFEQVVEWSTAGEPAATIIEHLDAANAFYPLTASELVRLHDHGVSLPVLDFIQDRYVRVVRRDERFGLNRP